MGAEGSVIDTLLCVTQDSTDDIRTLSSDVGVYTSTLMLVKYSPKRTFGSILHKM